MKLDDLNADENRNLLFQLKVPKINSVLQTKPRKFVKATRPSPLKLQVVATKYPTKNIEKSPEDHIIGLFHSAHFIVQLTFD